MSALDDSECTGPTVSDTHAYLYLWARDQGGHSGESGSGHPGRRANERDGAIFFVLERKRLKL